MFWSKKSGKWQRMKVHRFRRPRGWQKENQIFTRRHALTDLSGQNEPLSWQTKQTVDKLQWICLQIQTWWQQHAPCTTPAEFTLHATHCRRVQECDQHCRCLHVQCAAASIALASPAVVGDGQRVFFQSWLLPMKGETVHLLWFLLCSLFQVCSSSVEVTKLRVKPSLQKSSRV